jgi:hypothetical protein
MILITKSYSSTRVYKETYTPEEFRDLILNWYHRVFFKIRAAVLYS